MMQSHYKYNIIHLTNSLTRVGGIETLVNEWLEADPTTAAMALIDTKETVQNKNRRWGLRKGKWDSMFQIKKFVKNLNLQCKTLILHNFSGLNCLAGLIKHEKLIVYLHTNSDDILLMIKNCLNDVDGCIVSSEQLELECLKLRTLKPTQILYIEHPICQIYNNTCLKRKKNKTLIIGYAGRLEIEQKKVSRLVDLCAFLQEKEIPFFLQIAGDGSYKTTLLKKLARFPVQYLGSLTSAELKKAYETWDINVLTSDYETGPLTIFEGMACGSIPLIPKIECQATEKLMKYQDKLFYNKGDMKDAANKINNLNKASEDELFFLRKKLVNLVKDQRMPAFLKKINLFLDNQSFKREPPKDIRRAFALQEHLPFFVLSKIQKKEAFLR